jgi:hypothetical protein
MTLSISPVRISLLCAGLLRLYVPGAAFCQDLPVGLAARVWPLVSGAPLGPGGLGDPGASPVASSALPILPGSRDSGAPSPTVDWTGLVRASGRFLALEQAFRLMTEPGTREGLKGSFFHNYTRAVGSLHGWADGDEFYVNYVGHPMQGCVAGFLWAGNDLRYRGAEFGRNPTYWKARLRAAGFAWVYSTQFEIGTVSEASIGAIQAVPPQEGMVDHVITPSLGMGWMIAEDALDHYVIKRVEGATTNRWIRLLARSGMNPSRTFANVLRGVAPWHRDTREGITTYRPVARETTVASRPEPPAAADVSGPAPFELDMDFRAEWMGGRGKPVTCVGGGGTAAIRLSPTWQAAVEVGGCNLLGLDRNVSGDALVFLAGPRWTRNLGGPWNTHWQFLVGGNKFTEERMYPERKELLTRLAAVQGAAPPAHNDYTDQVEASGFAVAAGGGIDYKLNRALILRVAELSYRHSWIAPLWGRSYSESFRVAAGLVLRMGTW